MSWLATTIHILSSTHKITKINFNRIQNDNMISVTKIWNLIKHFLIPFFGENNIRISVSIHFFPFVFPLPLPFSILCASFDPHGCCSKYDIYCVKFSSFSSVI